MQTERKDFPAFGTTHFTITMDKGVDEIDEGDDDLKEALDTKKRFIYKWNNEHQGSKGDKLRLEIKDNEGRSVSGISTFRKGEWKVNQYLENCDW